MSDSPQGPGWWLASDGTWHPPELHPSLRDDAATVEPAVVPEAPVTATHRAGTGSTDQVQPAAPVPVDDPAPGPTRPQWSREPDARPESGPRYPDLFQQAVSGSVLADAITVNGPDGERGSASSAPAAPAGGSSTLVSASAANPGEVGAFTGASARKRRRWGH